MTNFYNQNIKEELSIKYQVFFDEWYGIVEDILLNEEFQKRKLFLHHYNRTVFEHSIRVSYHAFMIAKYFKASTRICAIAGLLHDFYPKAWLYSKELEELDKSYLSELNTKKPLFKMHGFTHGKEASKNYIKYFPYLEDKKITDAIANHMFPLTIRPPKFKEGLIVSYADKLNSLHELPGLKEITYKVGVKLKKIIWNI